MDFLKFNQIGFKKGFQAADHVLTLTIKTIIDKYRSKHQNLYSVFVYFRKVYDNNILRKYLFHILIAHNMNINFTSLSDDMHDKSKLSIRLPSGFTLYTTP